MKAKVRRLTYLIVALIVAVFTVGYAFAWFIERKDSDFSLSGASAGAYFESGDGSEETPFVIANSTHMRNLSVLQNTGRFVDENGNPKKYYFEIKKTLTEPLDMSSLWIPPIGSDENPFIGEFNGNGKAIKNLKVTTDKALLTETNYPTQASANYEFSQAVGLFGNTGEDSNIRNFILNNPHVVVGAVGVNNNKYSSGSAKAVGIAVGHVAGKCQSIGVRATDDGKNTAPGVGSTTLDVRVTGYSTFNSILGELAEGVNSSVTGGGAGSEGTGGSGNAFGASFDVESLSTRLFDIYLGKYGKTYKSGANERPLDNLLPLIDTQSDIPVPALGYKVPFTVDSAKSIYSGATAQEIAANNNVGYVMGNQNKISTKTLRFASSEPSINSMIRGNDGTYTMPDGSAPTNNKVPRWFYTQNDGWENSNYQERVGFGPISQEKYNELPDNIKSLLVTESNQRTYTVMRIQAQFNEYGTVPINSNALDALTWGYHGQISWMGKTYGEGIADNDGNAVNSIGYNFTSDGYLLDDKDYMFVLADGQKFYVAQDADWNGEAHSVEYIDNNAVAITDDGIYFGRYRASSDDVYIYGYLDENGYFYNEDGFVVAEAIDGVVASITAEGYAIAPDGKYYGKNGDTSCYLNEYGYIIGDDGYIVLSDSSLDIKATKTDSQGRIANEKGEFYVNYPWGWPNTVVTVDSDGYIHDSNGNYMVQNYPAVITHIDGDGYAIDVNGNYYDASGGVADADGYLLNSDDGSYYADVSQWYPLNQCSVDEEGYFVLYGGGRYQDYNGNPLRAYGYYKAQDSDGNYYLADEEGNAVTFKDEWGTVRTLNLKQASGNKVQVTTFESTSGSQVITAKKGSYITAKKGENIYVKSGSAVPLYAYKSGVALPNNGIWFKPSQAGKMRFVMFAQKDSESFSLLKCTRTNATVANPFYTNGSDDITVQKVIQQRLPVYALFYYEFEVKAEEVYNTEYVIVIDNNVGGNGAYFLYLDIGSSADEEVTDTSTVVTDAVSAIDFIYDGVEIEQTDTTIGVGNFIVNTSSEKALYEASKTSVYFDGITKILKVVYVRLHNDEKQGHAGKTICLENSDTQFDTTSEVKATFATYVCPTIGGGSGTVGGGGGTVTPGPGPDDPVAVTGVTLNKTTLSLTEGATETLTATVAPTNATNKNVTWKSSNTNVATVDSNGKITAVAAGTATITVTTADGSKTATCAVTVTAAQTTDSKGTYTFTVESGEVHAVAATGSHGTAENMLANSNTTVKDSYWQFDSNSNKLTLSVYVIEGQTISVQVTGKRNSANARGIYVDSSNSSVISPCEQATISLPDDNSSSVGTVTYTATSTGIAVIDLSRSAAGGTIVEKIVLTVSDGGGGGGEENPAGNSELKFAADSIADSKISDANNLITISKASGSDNIAMYAREVTIDGVKHTYCVKGKAMDFAAGDKAVHIKAYCLLSDSNGSTLKDGTITPGSGTAVTYNKTDSYVLVEFDVAANSAVTLTPNGSNRLNILYVEIIPQ